MVCYFDELIDLNNLYDAFNKCKKGVDWKYSTQKFESNILFELSELQKNLLQMEYKPLQFTEFDVMERGKSRHIRSPQIRDRVLQRAMCDYVLEPALSKYLIYDNGACLTGKGVEFSRKRLSKHLHNYYLKYGNEGYILVCDFSKFFDSIPHDKLIEMVGKHIEDKKFMDVFSMIIKSYGTTEGVGLGIGAQISQICGVFYPTLIDNYIKIVKGCKYYGRHMDDFYIIHKDKEFLKELLDEIIKIANELGLVLNKKKTQICKINKGFIFLKQHIFMTKNGRIIRTAYKKNVTHQRHKMRKFKEKLSKNEMSINDIKQQYKSWRGGLEKYNTYQTLKSTDKLFKVLFTNCDKCNECKYCERRLMGACWNCSEWNQNTEGVKKWKKTKPKKFTKENLDVCDQAS